MRRIFKQAYYQFGAFVPSATYQAILDRATVLGYTKPSIAVQSLQNTFINTISSIWSKLDIVRLFATNETGTQNFSLLNMKSPSSNLATTSGGMTYSYGGWKGNGTDGYIDNNWNPSTAGGNYSQNSAFEGIYVNKLATAATPYLSGHTVGTSSYMLNANSVGIRLNSGGDLPSLLDLSNTGFKCLNRADANNLNGYADLVKTDKSRTSFTMSNSSRLILRHASNYGDAEVSAYFAGGALTQSEQAILRNALNAYLKGIYQLNYANSTPINIYVFFGQSNLSGRGLNASINSQLAANVGATVYKLMPPPYSAIDNTSVFEELYLGNNNTTESLGVYHGPEMRFGYNMYQVNPNTYIIKYGSGGTSMATYWNAGGSLFGLVTNGILINLGLYNLRYTVRRPIVFRGVIFAQGESDCVGGLGASYQASYQTMIQSFLDKMDNAAYMTDRLRWFDAGVKNGGSAGYTTTDFNNVIAAKQYLMSNFITDNPTYASKIKGLTYYDPSALPLGDTQHYTAAGLDTMGTAMAAYFDDYVNE